MTERDPLRDAARYRVDRLAARDSADRAADGSADDEPTAEPERGGPPRGAGRMDRRGTWVDEIVRQAMARGEFDDLPLAGKPIPGLTRSDPDWWLKALIEREQITGVLPEALQLRKDDAALDERLDRERTEAAVREVVAEFNARIVSARRQLQGGPPVVTPTRDVDTEVARWRTRRAAPPRGSAPAASTATSESLGAMTPKLSDAAKGEGERGRRGSRAGGSSGGR